MELIIVPGLGENEKAFTHQISYLEELAQVSMFDYDAYDSIDAMVEALVSQLPSGCILVGHSLGGHLAMLAAAKSNTSKLIVMNSWAQTTDQFRKQYQMAIDALDSVGLEAMLKSQIPLLMHPDRASDTALIDQTYEMLLEKSPETYLRFFQALTKAGDLDHILPQIKAPTLVIHGRQDPLFSLKQHQFIAEKIPNAQLAIIEDCGHNAPTEQPVATTALTRLFLTL